MKITRIFVGILIFLIVLFFLIRNLNQPVKIVFLDKENPYQMELVVVMVLTFAIGLLVGFAVAVIQILALKNKLRIIQGEKNNLQKELDHLRNMAVEEGLIKPENSQNKAD